MRKTINAASVVIQIRIDGATPVTKLQQLVWLDIIRKFDVIAITCLWRVDLGTNKPGISPRLYVPLNHRPQSAVKKSTQDAVDAISWPKPSVSYLCIDLTQGGIKWKAQDTFCFAELLFCGR